MGRGCTNTVEQITIDELLDFQEEEVDASQAERELLIRDSHYFSNFRGLLSTRFVMTSSQDLRIQIFTPWHLSTGSEVAVYFRGELLLRTGCPVTSIGTGYYRTQEVCIPREVLSLMVEYTPSS